MSREVMFSFINYAAVFGIAFCSSWLLTPRVKRIAVAIGLVDQPGARRLHSKPTPRGGGLAVFIAFHLGCITLYALPWSSDLAGNLSVDWWRCLLVGSGAMLLVGLLDDWLGLSWRWKLLLQTAVISLAYSLGLHVQQILGIPLSGPVDFLVTLVWFLALVNAFNLIDGLDGLAAGLASVSALGLAAMALLHRVPMDALVLVALVGACLGFLRYNFHPASIFLGDGGSHFLGFVLAAVALPGSHKGTTLATVGMPLLAMGVPIFDTILAIWRRSVRQFGTRSQNSIAHADLEHLHHRLVRTGLTQARVALSLYVLNGALVLIGLATLTFQSHALGIFLIAFVIGTYVVVRHLARVELWDTGNAIIRGLQRPSSPVLSAILYPAVDCALLAVSLTLTLALTTPQLDVSEFKALWLSYVPIWCGVPFLGLIAAGTYSRVWSKARISEFITIGASLTGCIVLALGVTVFSDSSHLQRELLRAFCHVSASVALIAGLRCIPRGIEDFLGASARGFPNKRPVRRILIAGASLECLLFLKQIQSTKDDGAREQRQIVGLIDEDRNLRKRIVYGFRVVGGPNEVAEIVTREGIQEIVIVGQPSDPTLHQLRTECSRLGIALSAWVTNEAVIVPARAIDLPIAANLENSR